MNIHPSHQLSTANRIICPIRGHSKCGPQTREQFSGHDEIRSLCQNEYQSHHWSCYLVQLTFCFHSKTFSMKAAECWYTWCHGLLTASQISTLNSTDLRKPRWPVWQVRPSKFWHLLLSPAPCVTALKLIFSAPATLTCLSFSPSLSLQPPYPTMPTLARNTQWWVSFRKSFCHHHHPHLSPRATSIVCYASHLLHWSHCFRIIYMLLPTKMLTPWRQDLYLTHLC